MKALIALEDGTVFEGRSAGMEGEQEGEIVFNTSMTGYQEILTDPSYKGQIVTMTYPLIGNYGVNDEDVESAGPKVEAFVAREFSKITSNFRAKEGLLDYLSRHGIMAIEEVDTRALTKHIRVKGVMKAMISTRDPDPESLVKKARQSVGIVGVDLVKEVTCDAPYVFGGEDGALTVRRQDEHAPHVKERGVPCDRGSGADARERDTCAEAGRRAPLQRAG
jgi:carbamoyl-phosphate synthase small subunit